MLIQKLKTFAGREEGRGIGMFRTAVALPGGLGAAYLGMTLMARLLPVDPGDAAVVALLYYTLAWALTAMWIALAPTRLAALLRGSVPPLLFAAALWLYA